MSAAPREYAGIDDQLLDDLDDLPSTSTTTSSSSSSPGLLSCIRDNIIGSLQPFESPYGTMPCVYADWTASGRGLRNIESYE